jgi:hypothetical protein
VKIRCVLERKITDEQKAEFVDGCLRCEVSMIDGALYATLGRGNITVLKLFRKSVDVDFGCGKKYIIFDHAQFHMIVASAERYKTCTVTTVDINTELRHLNKKIDLVVGRKNKERIES